jgi:multiple antibiotic resistance protein
LNSLSLAEYLKVFVGLLAIINPLGAVPMFISLTEHQPPTTRRRSGKIAAGSMTLILLFSLVTGESVLAFFGITMASFRVGGGILVLLIAISMLHANVSPAKQTADEAAESAQRDSVAVVPLSIPLLAGPGAISTVIVYAHRSNGFGHYVALSLAIVSIGAIVLLALLAAPYISERLGKTGINIATRIMGLILAAIAVEFIAGGLRILFPGWG